MEGEPNLSTLKIASRSGHRAGEAAMLSRISDTGSAHLAASEHVPARSVVVPSILGEVAKMGPSILESSRRSRSEARKEVDGLMAAIAETGSAFVVDPPKS